MTIQWLSGMMGLKLKCYIEAKDNKPRNYQYIKWYLQSQDWCKSPKGQVWEEAGDGASGTLRLRSTDHQGRPAKEHEEGQTGDAEKQEGELFRGPSDERVWSRSFKGRTGSSYSSTCALYCSAVGFSPPASKGRGHGLPVHSCILLPCTVLSTQCIFNE